MMTVFLKREIKNSQCVYLVAKELMNFATNVQAYMYQMQLVNVHLVQEIEFHRIVNVI